MTERITALEAEIEAAQEAINEASLMAATESTSPADRLKRARAHPRTTRAAETRPDRIG